MIETCDSDKVLVLFLTLIKCACKTDCSNLHQDQSLSASLMPMYVAWINCLFKIWVAIHGPTNSWEILQVLSGKDYRPKDIWGSKCVPCKYLPSDQSVMRYPVLYLFFLGALWSFEDWLWWAAETEARAMGTVPHTENSSGIINPSYGNTISNTTFSSLQCRFQYRGGKPKILFIFPSCFCKMPFNISSKDFLPAICCS